MSSILSRISLLLALLAAHSAAAHPCPVPLTGAPPQVKFVTSDIELFWRAIDMATPETMADVLAREYLKKGSPGLADFTRMRIGDAKQLAATVKAYPAYYAALRESSRKVDAYRDTMLASFHCLQSLYPQTMMPEVYFVIGRMNSAGTVDARSLLIGVDMFGNSGTEAMAALGSWHKAVVAPVERLPNIVAHELIHAQQSNGGAETLLAAALNEGVADFIGELICGQTINPHLHAFAKDRHVEMWRAFEPAMRGKDLGRWLYQGDQATADWPADLGYVMGYRIAAAYYAAMPDKARAIRDMLRIADAEAFLRASGYAAQMEKAGSR